VASKEIVVNEVEAFLGGAAVELGQVGHQEDQWMVPGAQLQGQVQHLECLKDRKKDVNVTKDGILFLALSCGV
jgi:hypothetical protein